jgi:predicted negative regulator of RcsB-dependent stress response
VARKRLTRKEIVQEDRIHSILATIYDWGTSNSRLIVALLAVVAVSIVGLYFWRDYQETRREQVQVHFADALEVFHAPLSTDMESAEQERELATAKYVFESREERHQKSLERFAEISENYSGTDLGEYARYYAAISKHQLGETSEAREILGSLISETRQPLLRNLSRTYLAELALQDQDYDQAIQRLNEVLEEPTTNLPTQLILMRLGEVHEAAGNQEEALKNYRRVTAEYPTSEDSRQAQSRIDRLEAMTLAGGA